MRVNPNIFLPFVDCICGALGVVLAIMFTALTETHEQVTELNKKLASQDEQIANVHVLQERLDALTKERKHLIAKNATNEKTIVHAQAEQNRFARNLVAANLKNSQLEIRLKNLVDFKNKVDGLQAQVNDLTGQNKLLHAQHNEIVKTHWTHSRELIGIKGQCKRVAFVFDTSSSMKTGTFDEHKSLLALWIQRLNFEAFNIISFSTTVELWTPGWANASTDARIAAAQHITGLEPDGGTSTRAALLEAFKLPDIDTIVLFSDGAPTDGNSNVILEDVKKANQNEVTINVVAVGNYFDKDYGTFLQSLANQHGGVFLGR